ncbi:MAG: hypothetical protein VX246_17160 [Myxococcota bacterium]|nr:hypothetical protein [Myxococcota bacterium]
MPDRQPSARLDPKPGAIIGGWQLGVIAAALSYLVLRLLYLALHIDPAIPPDEITHAGFAQHQLAFWGLPADTTDSQVLGLVSHRPFLYSWVLARWLGLHAAVSSIAGPELVSGVVSELVWLRLANIGLALITVLAGLAFARRAGATAGACALFVVVLTNTPMWSFLSASVNYDNAAMALATLCFALLARYLDAPSPRTACLLLSAALAGVLTKTAFLPLAALIATAALTARRTAPLRDAVAGLRAPGATGFGAVGILLLLGALAVGIYGRNLAKFGLLEPAPNQVLELEAANQNRIFRQEHVLRSFRAGAIDYRQAVAEIDGIEHEGDRAGAMWMLRRARELRDGTGEPLMGRVAYAGVWTPLIAERLFGVMGHRALYKSAPLATAYGLCAAFGLLALAWRVRQPGVHLRTAAGIGAAYALILMQAVNYPMYVASGIEVEAIQARYLFPVFAPLLAACIVAAREVLPERARLPLGIAVGALFVFGDFPYFITNASAEWFGVP